MADNTAKSVWIKAEYMGDFSEGYVVIEKDGMWNFVDKNGKLLFTEINKDKIGGGLLD